MNPVTANKNVLMLKLPRTGSTYLAHLLSSHEHITFHHEYLNRFKGRLQSSVGGIWRLPVLRGIRHTQIRNEKCQALAHFLAEEGSTACVGASLNPFKVGFDESHLQRLVNKNTSIIVLTRSNLLKQHISHLNVLAEKQAGTERPYKSYNSDKTFADRTFFIGKDALAEIGKLESFRRTFLDMVDSLPAKKLFLTYEDHINVTDKSGTFDELLDFLELPASPVWTAENADNIRDQHFHKLVRDDLESVIENYEEVAGIDAMRQYL